MAEDKGQPEKEQGKMLVDVTTLNIPIGKKICPHLTNLLPKVSGFGIQQMVIFSISCVGEQCGSYNQCHNIQPQKRLDD